ncbi:MAG: ABC transporter substrate-binding protein [Clostridia bacterium]|nr:ABC transporter substrate-binding protein [Clostridia bacterium]
MKKIFFFCFILIFSLTLLCSCSVSETTAGCNFEDDLGREVTVSAYGKTAVLLGSFADLWVLAGGTLCAAADDAWEDFDIDIPDNAVNLGATENLSLEKLISAQPEFVIASTKRKQHIEWMEILESSGITVAYFDVDDFDDYLRMLDICTDITGRKDLYRKNGLDIKAEIDSVIQMAVGDGESRTYLLLRASASYIRAKKSEGTVLGEMLGNLGWTNIADSEEGILENLNIESIVSKNPDRIFIVQAGDDYDGMKKAVESMLRENPVWNEIDAVKNGRIHYMDKKLYNFKPNARWGEAYDKLEKILTEK